VRKDKPNQTEEEGKKSMISRTALIAVAVAAIAIGGAAAYYFVFMDNDVKVTFPSETGDDAGFTYDLYGSFKWDDEKSTLTIQKGKTLTFVATFIGDDSSDEGFYIEDFIVRANGEELEPLDMEDEDNADLLEAMRAYFADLENKARAAPVVEEDDEDAEAGDEEVEPVMITVKFFDAAGKALGTAVLEEDSVLTYANFDIKFIPKGMVIANFYEEYDDEEEEFSGLFELGVDGVYGYWIDGEEGEDDVFVPELTLYVDFKEWEFTANDFIFQLKINKKTDVFIGYEYKVTLPTAPPAPPEEVEAGDEEDEDADDEDADEWTDDDQKAWEDWNKYKITAQDSNPVVRGQNFSFTIEVVAPAYDRLEVFVNGVLLPAYVAPIPDDDDDEDEDDPLAGTMPSVHVYDFVIKDIKQNITVTIVVVEAEANFWVPQDGVYEYTYGQALSVNEDLLDGEKAWFFTVPAEDEDDEDEWLEVLGTFAFKFPDLLPTVATTKAIVVFTPLDLVNYAVMEFEIDIVVSPKPITVTPDSGQGKIYNGLAGADPTLTYSGAAQLVAGDAFTGALSRTGDNNVAGAKVIEQGTLTAGPNYDITFTAGVTFTITVRTLTNELLGVLGGPFEYNGSDWRPDPDVSGIIVQYVDFDVSWTNNIDAGTATLTITGKGNCTGSLSTNFTIQKRDITITPDAGQTKVYGSGDDPEIGYTLTGGEVEALSGSLTRSDPTNENAGTYAILIGTLGNDNYNITFVDGVEFLITKRFVTVTPLEDQGKKVGAKDPVLGYTVSWGSVNDLSGELTRIAGESSGTYQILIGTLNNPNYNISFTGGVMFTIDDETPEWPWFIIGLVIGLISARLLWLIWRDRYEEDEEDESS
jgi:hypothetical protein